MAKGRQTRSARTVQNGAPQSGTIALDSIDSGSASGIELANDAGHVRKPVIPFAEAQGSCPTGCSPDRALLNIDQGEVAMLGGFGDAPRNLLHAPRYAWRVHRRRRHLLGELARINGELVAAEADRDELLATLVDRLRGVLEPDPRFASRFASVGQLDRTAHAREEAFTSKHGDYAARAQELERELAEARHALAEQHAIQNQLATELESDDLNRRRAEALHKRALIEARAQLAVALQAAGVDATRAPANVVLIEDQARLIARLQARAAALAPAAEAAREKHSATRQRNETQYGTVAEAERVVYELEQRRTALYSAHARQLGSRSKERELLARQRSAALAEIGRGVLAARATSRIDASALERLRSADRRVARLTVEHEKHLRALDACDRRCVARGQALLALALIASVLVAIWILT